MVELLTDDAWLATPPYPHVYRGIPAIADADNQTMGFQVDVDSQARAWMEAHRAAGPLVIAYDVHRCCGGGRICSVTVRGMSAKDDAGDFSPGLAQDGTRFLIDRRAAKRLPARFGLTVRGIGPLKHLDLALEAEQWGDLLYT